MLSFGELVILVGLSCAPVKIINDSKLPWDAYDQMVLESIVKKQRCKFYYPNLPCLRTIRKRDYHAYWALCGDSND